MKRRRIERNIGDSVGLLNNFRVSGNQYIILCPLPFPAHTPG